MTDNPNDAASGGEDRFGIRPEAIRVAIGRHGGIIRAGYQVPTRHDVLTQPIAQVVDVLIVWEWECPTELVLSNDMVEAVIATLQVRPDPGKADIGRLIAELRSS